MIDLSFLQSNPNYAGKPVMILGLARSGIVALRSFKAHDIEVFVYDDNKDTRKIAEEYGGIWVDNPLEFDFTSLAFLMVAPGIPLYYPKPHFITEQARLQNCPILSDIELFGLAKKDNSIIIGITGTNGKSTTTVLAEHVLRELNKNAVCGGNIGVPALGLPDFEDKDSIYVLELSSFQLDLCPNFRPHIAVLLNITPDHLDRHNDMNGYVRAKSIMFDGVDTAIIVSDDEWSNKLLENVKADKIIKTSFKNIPINLDDLLRLAGEHNAQNITAVYHICKKIMPEMTNQAFRSALETFKGLPHRQEIVSVQNSNLLFINDSKATNADAAAVALDTYKNIYWIAGGIAKSPKEFDDLIKNHGGNICHAFLIGDAADDLEHYLKKYNVQSQKCKTLDIAVEQSIAYAGDKSASIVFSPACASFDQFLNFEERGDAFRQLVINSTKKKSA